MRRERALKVVLVVVGLLFSAGVYPLIMMVKQDRYTSEKYGEPFTAKLASD